MYKEWVNAYLELKKYMYKFSQLLITDVIFHQKRENIDSIDKSLCFSTIKM